MSDKLDDLISVIIPTSSIPSHPSTEMIRKVIDSVRVWFPEAWVHVLADGLRPEFSAREPEYREYLNHLMAETAANKVTVRVFDRHTHQATMVKTIAPFLTSPLVLWTEHDQALLVDREIEWGMMAEALLGGHCHLTRLMLTEDVHPLHQYLYFGELPGYPHLLKQKQWSGWTHLAVTDLYRQLLDDFNPVARMTVERYVVRLVDPAPWERWKLTSYVPDPQRAKRIVHLDGRAHPSGVWEQRDPNFEEQEVYPPRG